MSSNIRLKTPKKPTLIVITGPTAVGKTKLCVEMAQTLKTEIISADSRQFYKELSIGTAKPSVEEMNGIKHHFINSHSIEEQYDVNQFEKEALALLQQLFQQHQLVILTGGSGLYIDILCHGFDEAVPTSSVEIRADINNLYQKYGIAILQEKLKQLDPAYYQQVDLNNYNRLERAIEVCLLTGQKFSDIRKGKKQERPFNILKIALNRDKAELFQRINQRVDAMLEQGLLNEAKSMLPYQNKNALKTVGYTEIFEFLDQKITLEEAQEKIKVNTRRYAKRQLAWFKRKNDYQWFHPDEVAAIKKYILSSHF